MKTYAIHDGILYESMDLESTDNGIQYLSWIDGPQGAKFELYPISGKDTKDNVKAAKAQLHLEQDVVKIYVKWICLINFQEEKLKALQEIMDLNKSGYAGMMPNGNIVDRRVFPNAVSIKENKMLGIPKPKGI